MPTKPEAVSISATINSLGPLALPPSGIPAQGKRIKTILTSLMIILSPRGTHVCPTPSPTASEFEWPIADRFTRQSGFAPPRTKTKSGKYPLRNNYRKENRIVNVKMTLLSRPARTNSKGGAIDFLSRVLSIALIEDINLTPAGRSCI
jgi:hypothetical protein